eukprot:GHUV01019343.1.p1 GENE.GHUV01019343.1~~GHUV01019343.1.p1  ORF type:complete len:409 (+),score=85.82 GHUV01019343.1:278-1504(+)
MQSYTPPAQPGEAKQVRSYAELPQKRLVRALLAVSFGTMLEWYDFTIYTQLAPVISKVFFPEENAAAQAMSVWGVFAVGFLARPAGALLFGHLGDTRGRGTCLLFSVLLMGVPTVIVGCLPTYAQAGIAAPILLALLRFIQGLAMGGEFGAAMVYLSEIALPEYKAVTGSLGYVSLGVGVTVGILVVAAVTGRTPAAAMMVWGWRVPFLLAIFTLVAATILRYNMPESSEFLVSKEEIDEEFHKRLRQQMLTQQTSSKRLSFRGSGRLSFRGSAQHPQTTDAAVTVPTITEDDSPLLKDLEAQALATKHYVPLVELFRGYWRGILVQIAYTAWVGAVFYWGNTWLPSFFVKHAGIPPQTTIWMVLTGIIAYTITVPIGGIMSDRGVGPVTGTAVAALISGVQGVITQS